MVEPVFAEEELARRGAAFGAGPRAALSQEADVAAGAETSLAGVVDEHRFDGAVLAPAEQRPGHQGDHVGGERVQGRRPVEGQAADRAFDGDQNLRRAHVLNSSRAMITRMISLVPSRI